VVTLTGSNTTVITDFENGTHVLVVDTSNFSEFSPGEQYRFNFTVAPNFNSEFDYGLVAPQDANFSAEVASANVSFVAGEVAVDTNDDGQVTVQATDDQTVTGTSTFAPGTDVFVEAISNDDAVAPYSILAEPVEVQSNGTWTATLDFSAEEPNEGTTFTLDVSARDASTSVQGIIRGEPTVDDLTFDDQQSSGDSVVVQNANFSEGGFVAIHLSDNGTPGEVIGASSYLAPDTDNRIAIVLDETLEENQELIAMAHLDTDGDQIYEFPDGDGPYTENGSPVVDAAQITGLGTGDTTTATATNTTENATNSN
jgi:hypothetical protein